MCKIYNFERERRERCRTSGHHYGVESRPRHRTVGRNGHPGFVRIGDVCADIIRRLE